MPRPPAEPARSARDGRRHAACSSLLQNLSSVAASGAPPVRSRACAACSLASAPLGVPEVPEEAGSTAERVGEGRDNLLASSHADEARLHPPRLN